MRQPALPAFLLLLFTPSFLAAEEIPVGEPLFGAAPGKHYGASVTTDGENYTVVWQDWRTGVARMRATRVSGDGEILTPFGFPVMQPAGPSSSATNGCTTYTVWIDEEGVWGQLIPHGEPQLLSVSANQQSAPSVAVAGNITLVVWKEATGVYATRIAPDGRGLDGRGIEVSSFATNPQVVFDGRHFVVAVQEGRSPVVRFLLPHGGHVQREQFHIAGVASFALAPRHIAWEGPDDRIRVSRIDTATRSLGGEPVAVSPEGMRATMPAVASNGRETLVVWSERVRVAEPGGIYVWEPSVIRAARLSSDLTLVDTTPLLVADSFGAEDMFPSVASNGEDWLVTWIGAAGVQTARVYRNGAVGETVKIAHGYGTAVAWNGAEYVVAHKTWPEHVLHAGDVAIETGWYAREIAVDGNVVAYTRLSEDHGGVERVFIRRISSPASPSRGTGRSLLYR